MKYLLDTNMCIYIIRKRPDQVLKRLLQHKIPDIGISSITVSELQYGVEKSAHPERNKIALAEFLAPLEILPYDENAASIYGRVRAWLEKKGIVIGPLDMLIGSHALSLHAILVTNNSQEFERIPGLKIENWCPE